MRSFMPWMCVLFVGCGNLAPDDEGDDPSSTPEPASPTPLDVTAPPDTPPPGPIPAPDDYHGLREATDQRCSDGEDNDRSGYVDCDDSACRYTTTVTVCGSSSTSESSDETCGDGRDNDNDGHTDCADYGCLWNADVTVCDRDGDGYSPSTGDCVDHPELDWSIAEAPGIREMCGDSEDNNCDGQAEEPDCFHLDLGWLRISDVSDGDTVQVNGLGPVRFKGIDTPETYPQAECFGPDAKAYTESKLTDQVARIVLDPVDYQSNFKDETPSQRWLGHIYLADGTYLNGEQVKLGMACVWTSFACSTKVQLLEWEDEAQESSAGLWGECGGSVCF